MFVKTSLREAMHQVRVSYKLVCEVPIVLSAIFFLTEHGLSCYVADYR